MSATEDLQPIFSHAEPVLSVSDVSATIKYWQDVLGFPGKWTWGDPPSHGSVSWHGAFIQFSLNPQHAVSSRGSSIWIRVQRLELLYRLHQEKKADIVAPLEQQPWGMAQYTIRELNGHYVTFAGLVEDRSKSAAALPSTIRIIGRKPTRDEYEQLLVSVGWGKDVTETATPAEIAAIDARIEAALAAPIHAAVAENTNTGQAVGCALLLGDRASFYYVKDVMVHKDWQGRRIGTALMQELTDWLNANVTGNALVGLFTRDTLETFYRQFGFATGFAMLRYMNR